MQLKVELANKIEGGHTVGNLYGVGKFTDDGRRLGWHLEPQEDEALARQVVADGTWHNTGGNGRASAEWVRRVGSLSAVVRVMPSRCLLDLYRGTVRVEDEIPFETPEQGKAYADRWLVPREEEPTATPCWHCGGEGFHHLDCETLNA